jgi:DNA repair exonuclease SbcCD ATPase subunit
MSAHLTMEQLLATRDGDRSEPSYAEAFRHLGECPACQGELDRLHQRTARLRALPALEPAADKFPTVRARFTAARHARQRRLVSFAGLATAAALLLTLVGRDLLRPESLGAEEQLDNAISRSQQLENELHAWGPQDRVLDGRTAIMVIQLENRIARLDAQLSDAARLERDARLQQELKLWRERVSLMKALVDVHVTRASNVDL